MFNVATRIADVNKVMKLSSAKIFADVANDDGSKTINCRKP